MSQVAFELSGWAHLRAKVLRRPPPQSDPESGRRRSFEMREDAEPFLAEHPAVVPVLYEVGDKLREIFGAATTLVVERFVDPESSAVPDELFVRVKTTLTVEEARALLERFEEEWWLDNMQRANCLINVALEFV